MASSSILSPEFLEHLSQIHNIGVDQPHLKWYITATLAFAGMNYPELIPDLYTILLEEYIPEAEHMTQTRKIREALTKVCGIWGAAKTGSATRQLLKATPEHLQDSTIYRAQENPEVAFKRGQEMLDRIYTKIPGYDMSLVAEAAPDYAWIVNRFMYGHVFSFVEILDVTESGQCIVAALLSTDCQEQARNHMYGMLIGGAKREEVQGVRAVVMAIADKLGVVGKQGRKAVDVPHLS